MDSQPLNRMHVESSPLPPMSDAPPSAPPFIRFPLFIKILATLLMFVLVPMVLFSFLIIFRYNSELKSIESLIAHQSLENTIKSLEHMRYTVRIQLGAIILFFICSAMAAIYLISRTITRPIGRLLSALERLGQGEYGTSASIQTNDEFALQGYYFDMASARLKALRNREEWINHAKSNLLKLAAHQLRTPLTTLRWLIAEFKESDGTLPSRHREKLDMAEKSAIRMVKLIDSLLTLTRVEEGRFGYLMRKFSLVNTIQEVLGGSMAEAEKKGIAVTMQTTPELFPETYFDVEKIAFVVDNILSNALHYTPPKGTVDIRLAIRGEDPKREIIVSVQDSGIGMPPEEIEQLFTQFYRAPKATAMYVEGSGLGLFLSRNIIAGHGGRLWANSKPGVGSTFFFTIPLIEDNSPRRSEFDRFIVGDASAPTPPAPAVNLQKRS